MSEKFTKPKQAYIPSNFQNDLNIKGTNFNLWFFIQGSVIAILFFVLSFLLFHWLFPQLPIQSLIGGLGCISCVILMKLANGINNDSPVTYLKNWITYYKNKRIAYYNPRIKIERSDVSSIVDNTCIQPRDRVIAIYKSVKSNYEKKIQEQAKATEMSTQLGDEIVYFEDDLNVVSKPIEYMDKKEYKKYIKKKKAEEKRKNKNIEYQFLFEDDLEKVNNVKKGAKKRGKGKKK